jgi:hypothetical protein
MKKPSISLIIVFAFIGFQPVLAQLEKGTFILGGSAGFSTYSESGTATKPTGFLATLSPGVLYFPVGRLAVGVNLPMSYAQYRRVSSNILQRTRIYGLGPVVRYYFPIGKWAIFPEVSYTYNRVYQHYPAYDSDTGSYNVSYSIDKGHTWQVGLGSAYFFAPNIGLEARLFYKKIKSYDEGGGNSNMANLNLNIGFQIYLRKATNK